MSEKNNPIKFPNYDHSILSVSASIAHYYGLPTPYKTNELLDRELEKGYKNIVLFIADGLGENVLTHHLPEEAFLRQNYKETISSVFPPTTGAALTTIRSVQPPIAHGWLGWSLYFKQLDAVVELFRGTNMYTQEIVPGFEQVAKSLEYIPLWDQIANARSDVETSVFLPNQVDHKGIENLHQLMLGVQERTRREKAQFIFSYWTEPDSTEHKFGPYSPETGKRLSLLNRRLKKGCAKLKDTFVIITADHGQIPVEETIYVNDCGLMTDCLAHPLSIDMRAVGVFVKPDKKDLFESEFAKYLSSDFLLVSRKDLQTSDLFGTGEVHPMFQEVLGDYLIIGITNKILDQKIIPGNEAPLMKGCHAGLTQDEMSVPLIFVSSEKIEKHLD